MKLFDRFWIALMMFASIIALPSRTLAAPPTVVFSEIAWAGSSLSASDEWIELTNLTGEAIDLSGWTLAGASSGGAILTLPDGSVIPPYSTFIIANYDNTHVNSSLANAPSYVTAGLSLPNGGFDLHLYDAHGTQVDIGGGAGRPFAGRSGGAAESVDGRYASMERVDTLMSGNEPGAWADAQISSGFKDGILDLGTPGTTTLAVIAAPAPVPTVTMPDIPPTETPTTVIPFAGVLVINEFVVDPPEVGTEWIEVLNQSSVAVNLAGFTVQDAAGKATALPDVEFAAGTYYVIDSPLGKLNNDADTIVLRDPAGVMIDTVSYGGEALEVPKDGQSLARDSAGVWIIVDVPTRGVTNDTVGAPPAEPSTEPVAEPATEPATETVTQPSPATVVQPQPTSTTAPSTSTSPAASASTWSGITTVRFAAVYANTTGSDKEEEFITIENTGTAPVELGSWKIQDASGDSFTFSQPETLGANATMTLMRPTTKITLNNNTDSLRLIAPNGETIDSVSYEAAPKGATYQRSGSAWLWTGVEAASSDLEPSPSVATSSSAPSSTSNPPRPSDSPSAPTPSVKTASTQARSTSQRTVGYPSMTIAQAKTLPDKSRAQVEGAVIALPGTLARQTLYLSDESGGIQVYFYEAAFPELAIGQTVRVRGELTTSHGERRLKADEPADIVPREDVTRIDVQQMNLEELDEELVGTLLIVEGSIQSRSENKLIIEDGATTLTISLKSNPTIDANRFERGDRLRATGILTSYDDELRLRPRSDDDLVVVQEVAVALSSVDAQGGRATATDAQSRAGIILMSTTLAALALFAVRYALKRRRALVPA